MQGTTTKNSNYEAQHFPSTTVLTLDDEDTGRMMQFDVMWRSF
jgi:hypothetical protein